MIFIDAGYFTNHWLENQSKKEKENFNFEEFSKYIGGRNAFPQLDTVRLIRTYYYDGLVDPRKTDQYNKQRLFHRYLNYSFSNYEVRTGLIVDQGTDIQKGVDSLLAIDMINKAYTNQFDVAILVAGDLDHLPVVRTVKDNGKEVYGAYYPESYSQDLINEFDAKFVLTPQISNLQLSNPWYDNYVKTQKN
ncbi:MAG: hypothetical protein AUH84_02055 [Thaumarchaeota archaeon 13_1_40CM_4_38_7]|nr:MAG: hypothetical protein AUH84_02055 [Thaumarchaeota archaeon 13_1_40CM_4_38_7]OLD40626.1 MAG: hypothetical protein AUI60_04010 [Thaumarchaeota archaeon 13_1_40CM_2_39_4]